MTLIVPILSRSLTMALPRESIAKRKQDVPRVTHVPPAKDNVHPPILREILAFG